MNATIEKIQQDWEKSTARTRPCKITDRRWRRYLLCVVEKLTFAEIAAIERVSMSAVRQSVLAAARVVRIQQP